MKAQLASWWDGCEPRERILLSVLAGLVGLFALIFLLILPIQSVRSDAYAELDRAKADLNLVSRIVPGQGGNNADTRAPFDRSVLINASRDRGVKLTRVHPTDDGAFAVWIDDAQTESLYGFFDDLLSDYTVTMDRAIVTADANGRLRAQFTVR